ncbi:hypothetical protein [Methylobacterium platani]|uniref:Uncharacterized protein n=2 Tax=Methylobacterium platani TaxID=427683 RepID=A0A179S4J3_9HYPH|nr:hypothetical protein [Methylobacterium platani]KMO10998.1 hypothetical protein SQ03_28495 [Methylobacterium platani JCM 14648]OAS20997.1 hypothetical protein A5481_21945 [Methylobacterium platani]
MEQVVIVDPAEADAGTWAALRGLPRTHEFSDRVFVVEGEMPVIDALKALPGIRTPAQLDPAAQARLSSGERLSLRAWSERERAARNARPGDGLNWGSEGFRAP